MNNLYIVNVIIPATRKVAARTLQTKVPAADAGTARREAIANCPAAKNTLAFAEIVRCFPPLAAKVGDVRPSTVAPVLRGRKVVVKRIPAPPVVTFLSDSMSFGEAAAKVTEADVAEVVIEARKVAVTEAVKAEIAADLDAEMNPTTDSNFMAGVVSAYDVEAEGWTGWKVSSR